MQFETKLTGEAAALAREHAALLERLPASIRAFILVELRKWPLLFPPEQRYQRALLEHVSATPVSDLDAAVADIVRIESQAGASRIGARDPDRFQQDLQQLLRTRGIVQSWREAVDRFFRGIDPAIDARLHPPDAPRRLIVQIYGSSIGVQVGKLWARFAGSGVRVPLDLEGTRQSAAFLRTLFGGPDAARGMPAFFADAVQAGWLRPLEGWIIEAHEALHELWPNGPGSENGDAAIASLSYDRLAAYREEMMHALYRKIQTGVESPQAFAAYARSLAITPGPGTLLHRADILDAFVRDLFLTGNGTLFVNNTFVEWGAVQALRRAQPKMLVARYGVRDRLKPFSSMLLFSQPRATDMIPMIEDPTGSFVDVELLSYYVWLNAEKSAAYHDRTLYLFLAEGVDEMLAIRSDAPAAVGWDGAPARLADVCATMAAWIGVPSRDPAGRPIAALVQPVT